MFKSKRGIRDNKGCLYGVQSYGVLGKTEGLYIISLSSDIYDAI